MDERISHNTNWTLYHELVNEECNCPHSILGLHDVYDDQIARVYRPGATSVWIVDANDYSKRDESIHLVMKNGEEVVIDCEKLIAEWGVEGEASKTPVVLTREELDYDGTDEHHHIEPWQDVLRADVRLKDEEKTEE